MTAPLPCWFRDDTPGPATHVLVIGVSEYPFRPLSDLDDLPSGATSADLFARWMRDRYPGGDRRLGSIRLLLAPTDDERPYVSGGDTVPRADGAAVHQALHEWARDCRSSPDNVAVLYICGHGVQETDDGAIVMLRDAGAIGDPFDAAVDVAGVRRGLSLDGCPTRQWYFVDACRVPAHGLDDYAGPLRGRITLEPRRGTGPAHRPIFFAAAPGTAAWQSGVGSVFVRALLECLDLDARTRLDGDGERWGVTAESLHRHLRRRAHELAAVGAEEQTVMVGGSYLSDVAFLECEVPSVPVTLFVDPAAAQHAAGCTARIFEGDVQALERRPLPVVDVPVPAGIWTLAVAFDPPHPRFAPETVASVQVAPPRAHKTVTLR
ncbi:caspase family protein [Dactylosporangium sp. NPDC050588]|uniref:caspase family protein n=1 Tax=Dactylosporangium sp. NPDC050588 TaxID=3157211 RepID=UPI00340EAA91